MTLYFSPVMISVQKITGVMYSLIDGRREEKDLSDFQKKQAIKYYYFFLRWTELPDQIV